jgi:hypothetical protein
VRLRTFFGGTPEVLIYRSTFPACAAPLVRISRPTLTDANDDRSLTSWARGGWLASLSGVHRATASIHETKPIRIVRHGVSALVVPRGSHPKLPGRDGLRGSV